MCGLSIVINGTSEEVQLMGKAIEKRGIESNIRIFDDVIVYFTHLPITDQYSQRQPYEYGKYAIYLNGFISNWKELAVKYKVEMWSECDTELLSKFIQITGFTQLSELNGFFSIVVYDKEAKKLSCFTDRYGVKQLYQYKRGDNIYISSEVKGLAAVIDLKVNPVNAEDWIYSLGVMNLDTIYEGVERVRCLPFHVKPEIKISYQEAKERLKFLLDQSIRRNKVEGLKDGVFLSGGIDSGILANRLNPDYCFSMDYEDKNLSEIENIKLNTSGVQYTMLCNEKLYDRYKFKTLEALDDLKAGACYTNFALTELASKFCTVLYSGAGADEVFDGYSHRYNNPIEDIIRRTEAKSIIYPEGLTHKEYDWKYLKAILVVEDRMSGFHTMETRYPFLDNDLVDFASSLPSEYKKDKRILKDISGLHPDVINGRKRGFCSPISNYEWAKFALDQKLLS